MKVYEIRMILVTEDHINKDNIQALIEEFSDDLSEIEDLWASNFHFDIKKSQLKYPDIDRDDEENFGVNFDKWLSKSQKIINNRIKKK
jgi:hypothetical protein